MNALDLLPTGLAIGFAAFGALCVLLVVAGIPGTWILIAAAVLIDGFDWLWLPEGSPFTFHPITILVAVALGAVGEALEFGLAALGAKRFGASKRGMISAIVGGMVGGLVATFAIPIPIVGTLLGAAIGTALGAIIGETWNGERTLAQSAKPALGAVIGRVLGTLAKLPVALSVWLLLAVTAFVK